jgi:hypothetical protein
MQDMCSALDVEHGLEPTYGLWTRSDSYQRGNNARAGLDEIGLQIEHQPVSCDPIDLELRHQLILRT